MKALLHLVMRRPPVLLRLVFALMVTLAIKSAAQGTLMRWTEERTLREALPPGCGNFEQIRAARRRAWPLYLATVGVPLTLATLAFSWTLAREIRRRTGILASALGRISTGDFTTQLPPPPDPEAEHVYGAFNGMRDALAKAQRQLAHADAQRRRLFGDLTHELATPVSAVLGIVDTLAQPALVPTEADRARLLALLEGEAVRLQRLVGDMRDLAVLDEPEASLDAAPMDLCEHARGAVERFRALPLRGDEAREAGPRVSFELVVPDGPVVIEADAGRVDQVLTNLLTNAHRHTPTGGTVRVTVRVVSETESRAPAVELVVEDSGAGVPEPQRSQLGGRLFRPDSARDRRTGGHGLGLSIVRSIAEKHRGALTFSDSELGGLRATVVFPRG